MRCFVLILAILFCPMAARADQPSDACPPDQVLGQVAAIFPESSAKDVRLTRGGVVLKPHVKDCLIYGDRIEASGNARVSIVTASGSVDIGKGMPIMAWSAPEMPIGRRDSNKDQPFLSAWAAVFRNYTLPRRIVSRGSGQCGSSVKPVPIAMLQSLPVTRQKIGSDLQTVTLAWRGGTGNTAVTARLSSDTGQVLGVMNGICNQTWAALDVPTGILRPGMHLSLEAVDTIGGRLSWSLEVVEPGLLPTPGQDLGSQGMLGAWRLLAAGPEYRIDALSRLGHGDTDLATPRWLFSATLEDRVFNGARR